MVDLDIRELHTIEDIVLASRVFGAVWGSPDGGMPPNLLRALEHSGNYVVGVFEGERMVAASAAFFGPPAARSMHSHVTGVLPGFQARGIGRALKQHQREWAFARDVGTITWTFDPLIARNAHFNLEVLGARVTDYLVHHYGAMDDGVNAGEESDRLHVAWHLASPQRNPEPADVVAVVELPHDIEALRVSDPQEAAAWRLRVRDAFRAQHDAGLVVGGFRSGEGYLFTRP
ncbi:GNAT family N-acetyltransferase [Microbacterium dauci]|uniref:GNAT family N-acetyltransferase n=1 Tax=Microbacterium dauci TaxID=3048008 RepID=A0ABT6ZDS1_9MICO|nr:GNAT family N-acetyltransferase [Microbacterium sp. LX3-4]MDJ1114311.1 GNAT family N-acetyltransferase [Microbacterium sp. LX3-4]